MGPGGAAETGALGGGAAAAESRGAPAMTGAGAEAAGGAAAITGTGAGAGADRGAWAASGTLSAPWQVGHWIW